MQVECEQSKTLPISPRGQPVKDRLALSALCNNSSEHPYNSCSSGATSAEHSRLSQNLSSSSISSCRGNPMSPLPFSEGVDAPDFTTSRRLPPISDLKLFKHHQRSVPDTVAGRNNCLSDGTRIQIHSRAPYQHYHDIHPPAQRTASNKSYMTLPYAPHAEHSYAPSFSASPSTFSNPSYANPVLTTSPLSEAKPCVMARRRWPPPRDTSQPRSLSPPLNVSRANSPHRRGTDHSQSIVRVCTNCGVSQTRQWVRGENHAWLCHSCGQFWRKNGYSRPRALWNRPTFKRSSRKLKVTSHGVGDTRTAKGSARQTVSSSFLDGKKMIELETCLPRLHRGPVGQNVMNTSDGLRTR